MHWATSQGVPHMEPEDSLPHLQDHISREVDVQVTVHRDKFL